MSSYYTAPATITDGSLADAADINNVATAAATAFDNVETAMDINTTANTVAAESSDESCSIAFYTDTNGILPGKTSTGLTFNSATAMLTATGFTGPLTGGVTLGAGEDLIGSSTSDITINTNKFTVALSISTVEISKIKCINQVILSLKSNTKR